MSHPVSKLQEQPRRGIIAQVATTVFLGIPMTAALVVAMGAYCAFELTRFTLFPDPPQGPKSPKRTEESFTASLANFAQIHGQKSKHKLPNSLLEAQAEMAIEVDALSRD